MEIGILGSGHIGKTLALKLAAASHTVKVANSRGPDTIDRDVALTGARLVTKEEAVVNVEAVILSVPFARIPSIASLLANLPAEAVVIDTSNYIPARDERIASIENGKTDSVWVTEQLGRPIAKAWNSIYSATLEEMGRPTGHPERISAPVAADRKRDRQVTMALVEETGFDAYDAGTIADSWRQQCGSPAYCTEVTLIDLPKALASADLARSRRRQDLFFEIYEERFEIGTNPGREFVVQLSKILNAS
ncbi:NADPH-dependent F420 reductase [Agrobacterium tumefaciens]|jgi:predicted dinucleotide-binding enzyme|uniref:Dinucleotide-binding enzyme n=1 Tax=Agrobacterium tumefaciens TaxID=358 RepID=A0AAW8M1G1_AGRTU|nr:NAD(P)-binding domain-containing protein [Agrobacterium tumefaciens]MBP2542433.1 putative dinucleotide-binding enzyme [Agrobacterium tumefaciens]MBP2568018.1 putative dinucleotide-binding enzyme [Agrobacterium tumefaciens]MDP9874128.1 putative dinucleotide-binding enzyme [Agrobacterium tumefaciens]MDP9978724.1 putative dinucleotide-binding enzyme [Agrobacterium tumefaciens]MDR6704885.1 putative dinucleotide-binding enzyme [Agrobacterium tumefaciens]